MIVAECSWGLQFPIKMALLGLHRVQTLMMTMEYSFDVKCEFCCRSTSNRLWLMLFSDSAFTGKGFRASYTHATNHRSGEEIIPLLTSAPGRLLANYQVFYNHVDTLMKACPVWTLPYIRYMFAKAHYFYHKFKICERSSEREEDLTTFSIY